MGQAAVALGGNISFDNNNPVNVLTEAVAEMAVAGLDIRAISRFYRTPCFPAGAGPDYINACILLHFYDDAPTLLERLHKVEQSFGRTRKGRWEARTLDLDLLFVNQRVLPDVKTQNYWRNLAQEMQKTETPRDLILPHPRLQDRSFVLCPLADIAPHWSHPLLEQSVAQMLAALDPQDVAEVVAL